MVYLGDLSVLPYLACTHFISICRELFTVDVNRYGIKSVPARTYLSAFVLKPRCTGIVGFLCLAALPFSIYRQTMSKGCLVGKKYLQLVLIDSLRCRWGKHGQSRGLNIPRQFADSNSSAPSTPHEEGGSEENVDMGQDGDWHDAEDELEGPSPKAWRSSTVSGLNCVTSGSAPQIHAIV